MNSPDTSKRRCKAAKYDIRNQSNLKGKSMKGLARTNDKTPAVKTPAVKTLTRRVNISRLATSVTLVSTMAIVAAACGTSSASSKPVSAASSSSTVASSSTTSTLKYPVNHVTIISYSSPGAAVDLLAREIAKEAPKYFPGVTFTVQDVTGGGPAHGLDYLLSKPADGSVWAVGTRSVAAELATNLHSQFSLSQFSFLATLIGDPYEIAVSPSSGITSMKQLVAAAQKNPNFTFGGFSSDSPQELLAYLLAQQYHFKFNWVPYSGGNKAMVDVMGGHLNAGSLNLGYTVQSVNAGKLKVLGISTHTSVITAPTFHSLGINNVIAESLHWTGVLTRGSVPSPVKSQITSALVKMAKSQAFKTFDSKLGFVQDIESGSQLQSEVTQSYKAFQSAFNG